MRARSLQRRRLVWIGATSAIAAVVSHAGCRGDTFSAAPDAAANGDASTSDVTSQADGDGADLDSGDAGVPFCARAEAGFCTGFDEPAPFTLWTQSAVRGDASLTVDETRAVSLPASLLSKGTRALPDASYTDAILERPLDGVSTSVRLEYALRATTLPPAQVTAPTIVLDRANGSESQFSVVLQPTGVALSDKEIAAGAAGDGPSTSVGMSSVALALGVWHHVVVTLDLTGSNVIAHASLDGVEAFPPAGHMFPATTPFQSGELWAGVVYVYAGAFEVNIDDLAITAR